MMSFLRIGRKLGRLAFASAIFFGITSADVKDESSIVSKPTMKVRYLGGNNEMLRFNVKYEANSIASFKLVAISENGEVWFEDKFKANGEFDRKLTIPRLTETEYITFLLKTAKGVPELSYKVRIPTKVDDK